MKAIIQRVSKASVAVDGEVVGEISRGIMLLIGFGEGDNEGKLAPMADKVLQMRIFPDDRGRFDRSLLDIGGELLLVPQFTLFADTSKGRRPEFFGALKPELATGLFDTFRQVCVARGIKRVERGIFGAHMHVALVNDGPVTISVEL